MNKQKRITVTLDLAVYGKLRRISGFHKRSKSSQAAVLIAEGLDRLNPEPK